MAYRRIDSVLVRESFDAPFFPTRSPLGVFVEEVFPSGQLPIVEFNTKLKVPTGFRSLLLTSSIFILLWFHRPRTLKSVQGGGTYQPVRIVFLAGASCQFAMLLQIEVPTSSIRMGSREVKCL